jgi:PPOX class probable F420-dependent enzyme
VTTIPESHRDLLDARFATLATVGADDRPQLSEVWFLADEEGVRISINTSRQKAKNLGQRPGCTLFILDLENPMRYLELRGDAEVSADDDYAFADRVGTKYGADLREYDAPGVTRLVVTIHLTRVNAIALG